MSIKRFRPNQWKDCDGDWFSTGVEEHQDGKYVLYSDYMELVEVLRDVSHDVFLYENNRRHELIRRALEEK